MACAVQSVAEWVRVSAQVAISRAKAMRVVGKWRLAVNGFEGQDHFLLYLVRIYIGGVKFYIGGVKDSPGNEQLFRPCQLPYQASPVMSPLAAFAKRAVRRQSIPQLAVICLADVKHVRVGDPVRHERID